MNIFTMMVGLPGSGKSTYAKSLVIDNTVYLSSDKIREELYGDENCQENPNQVFELMKQRTLEALKDGKNVIYDATNIVRKHRIGLLKQLPKGIPTRCVIVWANITTCYMRDYNRNRTVGAVVIDKMMKRFETPWYDEGFDDIEIVINDDTTFDLEEIDLNIPHDSSHHPGLISEHIKRVEDEVEKLHKSGINCNYPVLKSVAKYHDIGKPYCKEFKNNKGEITSEAHYYDHQNVSAYLTLGAKDTPNSLMVSWLVNLHMQPFFNKNGESKYWKQLLPEWKTLINLFNECDVRGA